MLAGRWIENCPVLINIFQMKNMMNLYAFNIVLLLITILVDN